MRTRPKSSSIFRVNHRRFLRKSFVLPFLVLWVIFLLWRLSGTFTWPVGNDGLLTVLTNLNGDFIAPRHPIHDLMKNAERQWTEMVARQSKTLKAAVSEYQRRYGRMPPKGFDIWFKFASDNKVMLIDEFDQIDHDIRPYLATPPDFLRQRLEELESLKMSLHVEIKSGVLRSYGPQAKDRRLLDVADFIEGFANHLPDMVVHMSGHDSGSQIFGEDFRREISRVLDAQTLLSPANISHFENLKRNPRKGFTNACEDTSPAVDHEKIPKQHPKPVQFIQDHRRNMNFCQNPAILHNHGAFWYDNAHGSKISPYFVMCKLDQGGELLMPALSGYKDTSSMTVVPWAQRSSNSRLFWRGRSTGNHFSRKHRDWRGSHRIRLHTLTTSKNDSDIVDLLLEEKGRPVRKSYSRRVLNERYMDIGLVGKPSQCQKDDGTCEEMAAGIDFFPLAPGSAGMDSKFALDVDGNGWSQRYRKLLASGSVVFKMTIFPEWNTDWLIPFYHYVPVAHNYNDLYNQMAFFAGPPEKPANQFHDAMAERIAKHSVDFVANNWRWVDLEAYMFRLLLEYARAVSLDRDGMTMSMKDVR